MGKPVVARILNLAWILLLAVTLLLILASTPRIESWLERALVGGTPARNPADYPLAAAIVVLGGEKESTQDSDDMDAADTTATRLGAGFGLLLSQRAPVILLSGGKGEASRMKSRLLAHGVSVARILTETHSRNTHENALDSAPILRRLGAHRILLVTSGMHMRRAAGSFRKQGFEVIPAPSTDATAGAFRGRFWQRRERALKRTGECLHELLGLWVYECLGWA